MPIQIIDNRKLSSDENIWLKDLDKKLEPSEKRRITTEIYRLGKDKADRIKAYLYVIKRANLESLQEAGEMFDIDLAWDKLLIESGYAAKWEAEAEARGEEKGRAEVIELFEQGLSVDEIKKRLRDN